MVIKVCSRLHELAPVARGSQFAESHNFVQPSLHIGRTLSDKPHLDLGLAETLHDCLGIDAHQLGNLLGSCRIVGLTLLLPALLLEFLPRNRNSAISEFLRN